MMMRDGRGIERRWKRDRRGLVQEYFDAVALASPTDRYEYNHNDKLTRKFRIRDGSGPVQYIETETRYDAADRELYVTEAKGTTIQRTMHYLSRDGMGNPLEVLDYNGNSTNYGYNAVYKVKREVDSRNNVIDYEYYPTTKLHRKIDKRIAAALRTTTLEYDLLDRQKLIEDPLTQSTHKTYDDVGNLLTVTDKRGIVTEHEYDSLYRRTRTIRAGQQVERREYNDVGKVIAEYDAYNRLAREFEYTNRHLLDKTIFHNDGAVTTNERREYDGNGNQTTLIDEEGKSATYTYDAENRQLTSTFEGETTTRTYDKIGNLASLTLPEGASGGNFEGKRKKYEYDVHNRLVRVEEEEVVENVGGLVTRYGYDSNGNLRHIHDPLNNHVEYVYDDLYRRIRHVQHKDTGNLVTRFDYDGVGNLTRVTDAKGQEFNYDYDLLDRRVDANYPNLPSPLLRLAEIDFGYDPNSNLKTVTEKKFKPDGSELVDTIVNNYDQFDRLDDSTRRGVLVDYSYDNNGNRLSVSTPNHNTSYTYTLRNWVKTATLGGQTTQFDYLPDGKLDTVSYPNGTQADYSYHPTNRIQSISHTNPSGTLYSYSYTYDKNGNRETQAEFNDGITENTSYEYDPMNRLTAYTITGNSDPFRREYTYEGYNRKTEKTFEDGTLTEDKLYSYDQTNWLTRVAATLYEIDYTYDNNGNTLTKVDSRALTDPINFPPISFQYSARDRLVQVKKGQPGSEQILGQFDYNHEGNRVRHRLSDRGDVDYYYDDGAVLEERNAADDSLLAYYQYANRLIALAQSAGRQYYHHDALGSTIGLTDAAGADKKSYHLDPWGNIRWETGSSDNRYIFTGKEHDKNTGLVYFGARYYDPEVGRFITQDPYHGDQNTPPSLHRYLYAHANPTRYIDSHGYAIDELEEQSVANPENPTSDIHSTIITGEEEAARIDEEAEKMKNDGMTKEDQSGESEAVPEKELDATRIIEKDLESRRPKKVGPYLLAQRNHFGKLAYQARKRGDLKSAERYEKLSAAYHDASENRDLKTLGGVGVATVAGVAIGLICSAAPSLCVPLAYEGGVKTTEFVTGEKSGAGLLDLPRTITEGSESDIGRKLEPIERAFALMEATGFWYGIGLAKTVIKEAFTSPATSKETALPESYWITKKALKQVPPGTKKVETTGKPSSAGGTYKSTAYYDKYGRQIGQTHHTTHGRPKIHPKPHHHKRDPATGEKIRDPKTGSKTWPDEFQK